MRVIILSLMGILSAACDPGQLSGQLPGRPFIDAGEWEIANGTPGDQSNYKRCFTKDDIAKPELGVLQLDNLGCSRDKFNIAGGKISFDLACALPSESSDDIRMRGDGHYTATTFDITVIRSAAPNRPATISGKRLGDCPSGGQGS